MAINQISSIIAGDGGVDDEALLRLQLQHMMRQRQGGQKQPQIQHWTQGAAHVMNQVTDSIQQQMLMKALQDRANKRQQAQSGFLKDFFGGGQKPVTGGPGTVAAPSPKTVPYRSTVGGGAAGGQQAPGVDLGAAASQQELPYMHGAPDPAPPMPQMATPPPAPDVGGLFDGFAPSGDNVQVPSPDMGQPMLAGPELPPMPTPAPTQPPGPGSADWEARNGQPPTPTPQLQSGPTYAPNPANDAARNGAPPVPTVRREVPPPPVATTASLKGEPEPAPQQAPNQPMQPPPVPGRNYWNRMFAQAEVPENRVGNPQGAPITNPNSIITHDSAGRHPFGLGEGGQPMYNITVTPDGTINLPRGVHQTDMGPAFGKAWHAKAYNDQGIGIARIGQYGAKPTPEALNSLALATQAVRQRYGIPDSEIKTHGQAHKDFVTGKDPRRASGQGRSMAEASWTPSALGGPPDLERMAGGEAQPSAPAAPPTPPLVQYAQLGGDPTSDAVRRYLERGGNPQHIGPWINYAIQQRMKAADPMNQLQRRKLEAEVRRLEQQQGGAYKALPSGTQQIFNERTGQFIQAPNAGVPVPRDHMRDPSDPNRVMPVPGSKADYDVKQARTAAMSDYNSAISGAGQAMQEIDWLTAEQQRPAAEGNFGLVNSRIPNTRQSTQNWWERYERVANSAVIEALKGMRSPKTGATGFGALSDSEREVIKNSLAALKAAQSWTQAKGQLGQLKNTLQSIVNNKRREYEDVYGPMQIEKPKLEDPLGIR